MIAIRTIDLMDFSGRRGVSGCSDKKIDRHSYCFSNYILNTVHGTLVSFAIFFLHCQSLFIQTDDIASPRPGAVTRDNKFRLRKTANRIGNSDLSEFLIGLSLTIGPWIRGFGHAGVNWLD